jgi:hypothetical protein
MISCTASLAAQTVESLLVEVNGQDMLHEHGHVLGKITTGFTMHTGLAERISLHPFGPFRFADMLLS